MSKAKRQISSSTVSKGKSRKKAARQQRRASLTSQSSGQASGVSTSEQRPRRPRSKRAVDREVEERSQPRSAAAESSPKGSKLASYTVGALHGTDFGLGLALVVYGAMVHVTSVTAAATAYGLVLLLGAMSGAIGYYSGACNRRGLRASAVAGFLTCLLDIAAFIAVLASWDTFIQFLNDNHEALMLTEDSVKTIQGLKILFAIIFLVLAGLEMHRGLNMWSMKDTLPEQQGARVSPMTRPPGESRGNWFLSFFGLAKRKKTDDFVMFDDNASMESSLLWSKNGAQPTSDDYLEFVPEHERGLANFHSSIGLPTPPEDKVDY